MKACCSLSSGPLSSSWLFLQVILSRRRQLSSDLLSNQTSRQALRCHSFSSLFNVVDDKMITLVLCICTLLEGFVTAPFRDLGTAIFVCEGQRNIKREDSNLRNLRGTQLHSSFKGRASRIATSIFPSHANMRVCVVSRRIFDNMAMYNTKVVQSHQLLIVAIGCSPITVSI
jgi:hypothetical protein